MFVVGLCTKPHFLVASNHTFRETAGQRWVMSKMCHRLTPVSRINVKEVSTSPVRY